ncbi:MAG TPA: hypothetical protein VIF62_06105 [Labilithrix sp.]
MQNGDRKIGLKAVTDAREDRARKKMPRVSGTVWLGLAGAVIVTIIVSWLVADSKVGNARDALLAQQRAAVETVGKEWFPLRDRLESLTIDAAKGEYKGDLVSDEMKKWDFRTVPGLYLRLRVAEAKDAKTLRDKARDALKDQFAVSLLREPLPDQLAKGEGNDAGVFGPEQPWNLRQAYASTRVLTPEWADEVKDSTDSIRLRVFEQQYEKAKRDEIPLAIDIVKRAQFYLLVLDEDVPEAAELTDGGRITEEALQQVGHPTRVHVFNLKTGAEIVRLRRTVEAGFVFAGERVVVDPEIRAAMKRQVNNHALAQEVWAALKDAGARP